MFGSGSGFGAFTLLSVPVLGPAVVTGAILANTVTSVASSAGKSSNYRPSYPPGFFNTVNLLIYILYTYLRFIHWKKYQDSIIFFL